jgi:hypothetical protein
LVGVVDQGEWAKKTGDKPIVHIGVGLFSDELSGNLSKKWNHFDNLFIQIFSLPKKIKALFFVGTMRSKDWALLCQPVLKELLELQYKIGGFYASLGLEVLAVVEIVAVLADNPRAAKILSTIGCSGNFPCRLC